MSKLVANFIRDHGKQVINEKVVFPMIQQSINHRLENLVQQLSLMAFEATVKGIPIEINEISKQVIQTMIHENNINKNNSSTLNDFLANFYEPNETDATQLMSTTPASPALTLDNLKQFWNPKTSPNQGINLKFPGSDDVEQKNARLSAYIILWYTIIEPALVPKGGGRKRLSGVRRSSNNKRYKSRGPSKHKRRRTKRHTRRQTKHRHY